MRYFYTIVAVSTAICFNAFGGAGPGPWANGAYYPGQLDGRYSANVYNDNTGASQSSSFTTNTFLSTNTVTTTVITNTGGLSVTSAITTNIVTPVSTTNQSISPTVVSGVLGFGIKGGTPSVTASSNAATPGGSAISSASALQTIGLESSYNYFLIYVNGDTYVGTTAANINPDSGRVAGALANGVGRQLYVTFSNQVGAFSDVGTTFTVTPVPSTTASGYFNAKVKNNKSPYTFKGKGTLATSSASGNGAIQGFYDFQLDGIKSGN